MATPAGAVPVARPNLAKVIVRTREASMSHWLDEQFFAARQRELLREIEQLRLERAARAANARPTLVESSALLTRLACWLREFAPAPAMPILRLVAPAIVEDPCTCGCE
jgi:hypothetical protein